MDTTNQNSSPSQPSRVGGFEILEKIGEGGMGVVYRARQTSLDRIVALKLLTPKLAADTTYIERFIREAKSAARLKHQNIVGVHDAGKNSGVYYYAMEYVSGETLSSWVKREGALPERTVLSVGLCVASALKHAWNKEQLAHRGISPRNICTGVDGIVRVFDLGLAKPDGLYGDPRFMAPEQLLGRKFADCRLDMYALGLTIYFMMTARVPFETSSPQEFADQHLKLRLPDPRRVNPAISPATCRVLERMLAREPADRYHSWDDVLIDLGCARNSSPLPTQVMAPGKSTLQLDDGVEAQNAVAAAVEPLVVELTPATLPSSVSSQKELEKERREQATTNAPAEEIAVFENPAAKKPLNSGLKLLIGSTVAIAVITVVVLSWHWRSRFTDLFPVGSGGRFAVKQERAHADPQETPAPRSPELQLAEKPKDVAAELRNIQRYADANPQQLDQTIAKLKQLNADFPDAAEARQAQKMLEEFNAEKAAADEENVRLADKEQKKREEEEQRRREEEEQRQAELTRQKEETRKLQEKRQRLEQLQQQMAGAFSEFLDKLRVALGKREYAQAKAMIHETSQDPKFEPFSGQLIVCSDITRRLKKFWDSFNANLGQLKGKDVTFGGLTGKIADAAQGEILMERPHGSVGLGIADAPTTEILALADLMQATNPADTALDKAWFSLAEGKTAEAIAYLEAARSAGPKVMVARFAMGMLFPEILEIDAEKLITALRELASARNWTEAATVMKQLKGRFANTRAYLTAQPELAQLESTLISYKDFFKAPAGAAFRTFQCPQPANCVAISPDGRYVAAGGQGTLELWDVMTGKVVGDFETPAGAVTMVAFSPDGRFLVANGYRTASGVNVMKKWEVSTGREATPLDVRSSVPISFTSDGRYIVGGDTVVRLWDAATGQRVRDFAPQPNGNALRCVAPSANGGLVAITGPGRAIEIWDLTGKKIQTLQDETHIAVSVALTPDGKNLVLVSAGNSLRVWDLEQDQEVRVIDRKSSHNIPIVVSPDGRYAMTAWGPRVKLWDITTGRAVRTFEGHSFNVRCLAYSPDRRFAASGSDDKTLRIWKLWDGDSLSSTKPPQR